MLSKANLANDELWWGSNTNLGNIDSWLWEVGGLNSVFFPVTTESARDTTPVKFCHGHFWLFTGILSKIVTGKLKNFTVIFSKKVTGKLEISRSIRKKVVTGNLKFVTGTFALWPQNFWFTAITTKVIFGLSLVASIIIISLKQAHNQTPIC